jgi:hypothetical protein
MCTKKLLPLLIFISFSSLAFSQPYSCNTDDQGKFYVMDGDVVREIEYLPPLSFKIGANCIAYVDNTQSFKIYYKGESKKLADGYTTSYNVSTDLVVIAAGSFLYAYDEGQVKLLSPYCSRYVAGDSIVAFNDSQKYVFNYYWHGKIEKLEDILGANPVISMVVGKNIIAYNNIYNNFRIVYQGEVIDQESQPTTRFRAGANIVAYTDYTGSFKIFYKGETTEIGGFPPKRFLIGDNLVAFIDNVGSFKIFYDGSITDMGTYTPTYFTVVDNMVVYADAAGGLSVFYKGNTTRLENYIPQGIQVSPNSVTYIDNSNRVQFFTYGKSVDISNDEVDNVKLTYDVLKIKTGFNSHKYYWKDKVVDSN